MKSFVAALLVSSLVAGVLALTAPVMTDSLAKLAIDSASEIQAAYDQLKVNDHFKGLDAEVTAIVSNTHLMSQLFTAPILAEFNDIVAKTDLTAETLFKWNVYVDLVAGAPEDVEKRSGLSVIYEVTGSPRLVHSEMTRMGKLAETLYTPVKIDTVTALTVKGYLGFFNFEDKNGAGDRTIAFTEDMKQALEGLHGLNARLLGTELRAVATLPTYAQRLAEIKQRVGMKTGFFSIIGTGSHEGYVSAIDTPHGAEFSEDQWALVQTNFPVAHSSFPTIYDEGVANQTRIALDKLGQKKAAIGNNVLVILKGYPMRGEDTIYVSEFRPAEGRTDFAPQSCSYVYDSKHNVAMCQDALPMIIPGYLIFSICLMTFVIVIFVWGTRYAKQFEREFVTGVNAPLLGGSDEE